MTNPSDTEVLDEAQAWNAEEALENPQLAAVKAELKEEATADDDLAAAQALADAELAARNPKPPDPVIALSEQVTSLQRQLQEQKEADEKRIRDLNGHFGGLKRELEQVREQATVARAAAATPAAQAAIAEAVQSPAKWEAFKKEWEGSGITEAIEEFVASQKTSAGTPDVEKLLDERLTAREAAYQEQLALQRQQIVELTMSVARPGWREVVKSPEFHAWRAAQPADVQALGASASTDDAIKMLKLYDESTAKPAADKTQQNRERLQAAVNPTRAEVTPRKTLSVNEMTPAQLWAYEARLEAAAEQRR